MDPFAMLRQFILAIHPLSEAEQDKFLSIWSLTKEKRKVMLTRAGEIERHLYFVAAGIQRVFYSDEQGKDATIVFTYAPSFSGVADSFLTQTPSAFFAETITPSIFLKTSFTELNELMNQCSAIERMVRISTNFALKGVLERMVELQCYTSEEKFKRLMKRSPHLLNLVPHKYIASYLGIDPTNFSKLLARVRI